MANTNAPFGFKYVGRLDGSPPNAGVSQRQIAYDNSTAFYYGDPVVSLGTGYIAQATAGTTQIAGIFIGCMYYSSAQSKIVHSMYWPGSGNATTGTATALVITDPLALFEVQATSTALTIADIDSNLQFTIGTGSTVTGLSAATVDTPGTTVTLPFRMIGLSTTLGNGGDSASSYNRVIVNFNYVDAKSTLGIN